MKKSITKSISLVLCMAVIMTVSMFCNLCVAEGIELLNDPGMELQNGGWTTKAGPAIKYVTDDKRSGDYSLLADAGVWFTESTSFKYDKSKMYEFSIWLKGNGRYVIGIPCYDSYGNTLDTFWGASGSSYGTGYLQETNVSYDNWVQKKILITGCCFDSNTDSFGISIRTLESGTKFCFDDASLVAYDKPDDFNFNGNVINDPLIGAPELWNVENKALSFDYDDYHSAPMSVSINYDGKSEGVFSEAGYLHQLECNEAYELSVWMKTDISTDTNVRLAVTSKNVWYKAATVNLTTEWKQYKVIINISDTGLYKSTDDLTDKIKVTVNCATGGTPGTVYVDDVSLRKVYILDSAEIEGDDSAVLPDYSYGEYKYIAKVYDIRGREVPEDVVWSVDSEWGDEISISDDGMLKVSENVLPGSEAVIKAMSKNDEKISCLKTVKFVYNVSDAFKNELNSRLKNGDVGETVAFLSASENKRALASLGVRMVDFNDDRFDGSIREQIVSDVKKKALDNLDDNIALLNEKIFMSLIGCVPSTEEFEKILLEYDEEKSLNVSENKFFQKLSDKKLSVVKNEALKNIMKKAPFDCTDELRSVIYEQFAVTYFSYITSGQVEEVLFEISKDCGLDSDSKYKDYVGMSANNSKKAAINKAMVGKYDSFKEIANAFDDAYDSAKKSKSSSKSEGSSGGSSSSRRSSEILVPNGPVVIPAYDSKTQDNDRMFNDMQGFEWAEDAVNSLVVDGIINGYGDKTFRPGNAVMREEFVKMLMSAINKIDLSAECDFYDVDKSKWYYAPIASAVRYKIVNGVEEGKFGTGEYITREQMSAFVMRALSETYDMEEDEVYKNLFADDDNISEYARGAVYMLKGLGVISGMPGNMFMPQNTASRAEAAKVIYAMRTLKQNGGIINE